MSVNVISPSLALGPPLILLLVGLIPSSWANAHPRLMAQLSSVASWLALFGAIAIGLGYPLMSTQSWTLYEVTLSGGFGQFAVGTYVNAVTAIMLVLVSFVGVIVTRYSRNYLDGDPHQGRFNKWLALTLAAILSLIVAENLLLFALAWIATSLFLHQLLMFYNDRPTAVLSAHKKFVASRIGDLSLLGAIVLIGSNLHTLQFGTLYHKMGSFSGSMPLALNIAAILIVLSAGLKSAQFPLHGWLLQVMEAPTPVSALLHAGIVNAGAFLVIRMSPIVSNSPIALGTLAVVGQITLALASLVMLTQTSIKVSLAWSTTAQMGFMLLECGLGLYSLAMLHLVAHSLYKAHAFLASGSGVDGYRTVGMPLKTDGVMPARIALALLTSLIMTVAIASLFGVTVSHQPGLLAAGAIVAIALSQLLLQTASTLQGKAFALRGLGPIAMVPVAYFTLHKLFAAALVGSVVPLQNTDSPFQIALALAISIVFLALLVTQQLLKYAPQVLGDDVYMHLYNGLYIDVYITRMLQRVWPSPMPQPDSPPPAFASVAKPATEQRA